MACTFFESTPINTTFPDFSLANRNCLQVNLQFYDSDTDICKDCEAAHGAWVSWKEADVINNVTEVVKNAKEENPDYQIVVG